MDILIRDIDPIFVKEIERKAKGIADKLGTKFSRNDYIRMLIQRDAELRLIELKEQKFDEAVKNQSLTNIRLEKTLQEYIDSNVRLFHLLASGIDIAEGMDSDER